MKVLGKRFATGMVRVMAIVAGVVIFTTSILEEGYLRGFGWGVFMALIMLLMGRFGLWMLWEREEKHSKR